jgi:hypothetical protein
MTYHKQMPHLSCFHMRNAMKRRIYTPVPPTQEVYDVFLKFRKKINDFAYSFLQESK